MARKVPTMATDEEAEAFLDQNLADLDFAQFKTVKFEFEAKDARVNMRVPRSLLDAVKEAAEARGMPYQRYVRQVLEDAVQPTKRTRS